MQGDGWEPVKAPSSWKHPTTGLTPELLCPGLEPQANEVSTRPSQLSWTMSWKGIGLFFGWGPPLGTAESPSTAAGQGLWAQTWQEEGRPRVALELPYSRHP